ncbi:MAG: hypothetical protein M0R80_09875 [Proteobacteria bacterium]|jgi:hypothetical protein|nr:hypothetical protein [Pseudomonadota bacterium]
MKEEIEIYGAGAVLCPSCQYGLITKAYNITFWVYAHGTTDCNAHSICPYCGETVLITSGSDVVHYRFEDAACMAAPLVVVDR